jgi:hypothetical protein
MPFEWYARTVLPLFRGYQGANFLAATSMDIHKKSKVTWDELYEFLKKLLSYGDDPFEDMYSELYEELKTVSDPQIKKNIETILQIMDVLRKVANF